MVGLVVAALAVAVVELDGGLAELSEGHAGLVLADGDVLVLDALRSDEGGSTSEEEERKRWK